MRHHRAYRLFALLFAAWFGIVGLEPGALGACPMHWTNAVAAAAAMAQVDHDASAMSMPMGHGGQHGHGGHHCNCPGQCCAVGLLAMPVAISHAVTIASFATRLPSPTLPTRSNWTDFVLPFATAPPTALTA